MKIKKILFLPILTTLPLNIVTISCSNSNQIRKVVLSSDTTNVEIEEVKIKDNQYLIKLKCTNKDQYISGIGYILIGSTTLSSNEYSFDDNNKTVIINTTIVNKYSGSITIKPTIKPSIATSFDKDSWENIIEYANKGLEAMLEHYKPVGNTFILTPSDSTPELIAAKTRHVTLDGYGTFDVRVIGECCDQIDNENKATLTFEFVQVIDKCAFRTDSSAEDANVYKESDLRTKINEICNHLPDYLKQNIQTVSKKTIRLVDSKQEYVETKDKLFALSLDEVYGVLQSSEVESQFIHPDSSCYSEYLFRTQQNAKNHIKQYYNQQTKEYENQEYWLRSSYFSEKETPTDEGYTISNDGRYTYKAKVNTIAGICPCFCIGMNKTNSCKITASIPGFELESSTFVDPNEDITIKFKPIKYDGQDVCKMPDGENAKANIQIYYALGRLYNDEFEYNKDEGTIKIPKGKISGNISLEIVDAEISLSYDKFVDVCQNDENNELYGNEISKYFKPGYHLPIPLDEKIYKANIIDLYHDQTPDGKRVALTLEFFNGIENIAWDLNKNKNYAESNIDNKLIGPEQDSIINKMKKNCPDLVNGIKTVDKSVLTQIDGKWKVRGINRTLFILSEDEIFNEILCKDVHLGDIYRWYDINCEDLYLISHNQNVTWTRTIIKKEEKNYACATYIEMGRPRVEGYAPDSTTPATSVAFCI